MDIPRPQKKKYGRYIGIGVGVLVLTVVTVALARLEPAAPSVERATVWMDTVEQGELVRQVRGPGTLVPEDMRWISAVTAGRIEQRHVRPGATVQRGDLLLEMSNPDVQLQALEAERQLASAQAALVSLRTQLQSDLLSRRSQVEQTRVAANEAARLEESMISLGQKNLASDNEVLRARETSAELRNRLSLDEQQLRTLEESLQRQIALAEENVSRQRAVAQFQRDRVQSMQVRAGSDGVVQEIPWEVGQWANSGAVLARIAQPGKLKAVLRIPETQVRDIAVGQPATIDTRNGLVQGHVMRIDPASVAGTVTIEVSLPDTLPRGARPDLSVDGTVEIERLENVMHVGRPAYGQAESQVGLFKLEPNGKEAVRVSVRLGRSSVNEIEIVNGLQPGDVVILSDLSQYDSSDRIRLN
ncbi:MAG TPA: HlyD family efflux transporter periplasmic adaptor subunit [Gemmatimonadaceae bacterium]|nr:HlyD family efflux transporter periplasmic adaptor subunit [Gemmatimonadaceae bacterium]